MTDLAARWREFERELAQRGLAWALEYAPAQLRYTRSVKHRHGAQMAHLLPADYQAFVAEVGYPVLGYRRYDQAGISFLPPEAMESLSVNLPNSDDQWPQAVAGEPTRCLFAFFAGWDLSDIEGYAFGPADEDGGELVVWLVENGMARRVVCGTFTEWLTGEISRQQARVADCDPAQAAELEKDADDDPHRLLDYALDGFAVGDQFDLDPYTAEDLGLVWVERQEGSPYSWGLVDSGGNWLIPLGKRFRAVRPFHKGVAEVILNDSTTSYAGPWTRIRTDGSIVQ